MPTRWRHGWCGSGRSGLTTSPGATVPTEGVEPSCLTTHAPEACSCTNSDTSARDQIIGPSPALRRPDELLPTIATMRRNADVVIVGGGIIGASIAYHLTKKGVHDILVLERDRLGSGSTGKNAGGIRLQFSSEINVKLSQRSLPHIERFADEIGARTVVNAAGPWAAEVAKLASIELPIQPLRRHIFVTEPVPGLDEDFPLTIEFATGLYGHRESGGVLLGMADPNEKPAFDDSVNWDFMPAVVERALSRFPILERTSIKTGWAGLYEDTPDKHPILGTVDGVDGFINAAGFSGHGVMHAPVTGELISELIVDGRTSLDISALALSRFRTGQLVREHNVI